MFTVQPGDSIGQVGPVLVTVQFSRLVPEESLLDRAHRPTNLGISERLVPGDLDPCESQSGALSHPKSKFQLVQPPRIRGQRRINSRLRKTFLAQQLEDHCLGPDHLGRVEGASANQPHRVRDGAVAGVLEALEPVGPHDRALYHVDEEDRRSVRRDADLHV